MPIRRRKLMEQTDLEQQLEESYREFEEARQRMLELKRKLPRETFEDFALTGRDGGKVRLSELFGDRKDLIVVHNMGRSCPYCTMWADGFNGVLHHLEDRAAFVVVSPDAPEEQSAFAERRGWRFRMLSAQGSGFTRAAGYEGDDGSPWPGVSAFRKTDGGAIERVGQSPFGPGDEFCAVWHLFGLLADGVGRWQPRFAYE
jgi:predicted dithiol-disulfide oxidoreductase (DUF899 family)